jgi:hypothetical protein
MVTVTDTEPKIIVPFSMMPKQKEALQAFLDAHFEDLKRGDRDTKLALQAKIRETFPREKESGQIGSLEEIKKMLAGESEYAVLVRNCPEREGLEHRKNPTPQDTYSYYLGQALFEMSGARHLGVSPLRRSSHIVKGKSEIVGNEIHRDLTRYAVNGLDVQSPYVVFSSPYNGEHAQTQLINLAKAIADLPEDVQQQVKVVFSQGESYIDDECKADRQVLTLKELLTIIKERPAESNQRIQLLNEEDSLAKRFSESLKRHSAFIDMQPGDLLIENENSIWHRAYPGDQGAIKRIPPEQELSRFFLHNAGGPVLQR